MTGLRLHGNSNTHRAQNYDDSDSCTILVITMNAEMNITLLETVRDVEKFHNVFVNTLPDMVAKTSPAARWRARKTWMAFMRENAVEFGQRWPELIPDFIDMMLEVLSKGRGGEIYLGNAQSILSALHSFVPPEDEI